MGNLKMTEFKGFKIGEIVRYKSNSCWDDFFGVITNFTDMNKIQLRVTHEVCWDRIGAEEGLDVYDEAKWEAGLWLKAVPGNGFKMSYVPHLIHKVDFDAIMDDFSKSNTPKKRNAALGYKVADCKRRVWVGPGPKHKMMPGKKFKPLFLIVLLCLSLGCAHADWMIREHTTPPSGGVIRWGHGPKGWIRRRDAHREMGKYCKPAKAQILAEYMLDGPTQMAKPLYYTTPRGITIPMGGGQSRVKYTYFEFVCR